MRGASGRGSTPRRCGRRAVPDWYHGGTYGYVGGWTSGSHSFDSFESSLSSSISAYEATQSSSSGGGGGGRRRRWRRRGRWLLVTAPAFCNDDPRGTDRVLPEGPLMPALIIVVVVCWCCSAVFFVVGFNRLRTQNVGVDEALGGVDVQLTRRADLIPNLVNTVKGYAQHERAVFEEVTEARAGVKKAAEPGPCREGCGRRPPRPRVFDVLAVAEAYPDLKASANFLQLQGQLSETESQLAFARQYYNDKVASLNTSVSTIPWMFFAGPAGVSKREFYDAPEGQQTPPTVQF